ncbi:putative 3-hydroxyacyl-CoA dehydrogenase [Rugosimonospora africana]|uniref:Putative 3-hydroxyacyl-CoA dehydrogenase n=1 Tax=Rugosimonospora africana TaxID=556532 RepID=A0A8J3QPH8_9ACTN|nr:putative 3-hydroxyacyl-CoA dehydrogenase [Rugosimonospora africana]
MIGAGTMGIGIAYVAAGAGYRVEVVETSPTCVDAARERLRVLWAGAVARGRMSEADASEAGTRIAWFNALAEVDDGPDVIVEAVPERLDLKRAVLAEAAGKHPALLGSNTSSIPIGSLGERVIGLHFFNPVWVMPLLEIVVADGTGPDLVDAARALATRLGKDPIVVRDMPGFATSRLGIALGLEAIRMVEDGVASAADIDKAMMLGYRHPMGPLELTDLVGLDVRLDIARTLRDAYGPRFEPPALLESLVEQGRLGRKTGHGFYEWRDGVRQ